MTSESKSPEPTYRGFTRMNADRQRSPVTIAQKSEPPVRHRITIPRLPSMSRCHPRLRKKRAIREPSRRSQQEPAMSMSKDEIIKKHKQYLFPSVNLYYTDPLVTDRAS